PAWASRLAQRPHAGLPAFDRSEVVAGGPFESAAALVCYGKVLLEKQFMQNHAVELEGETSRQTFGRSQMIRMSAFKPVTLRDAFEHRVRLIDVALVQAQVRRNARITQLAKERRLKGARHILANRRGFGRRFGSAGSVLLDGGHA